MTVHAEAITCTVITCRCGRDFDGFSVESARQAFEDHLTEHEPEGPDR